VVKQFNLWTFKVRPLVLI